MSTLIRLCACPAVVLIYCASAASAAPTRAGGVPQIVAPSSAPRGVTLRITPRRVDLGQTFTVILSGVRPSASYTFVMQPAYPTGGFGGGLMGERRANLRGTVVFVYPAGTQLWEAGTWRVTAGLRGSSVVASATVTFVAHPSTAAQATPAARQPLPPQMAGCPADTVRNSALGVTLILPSGWHDYGTTLFAPGGLFVADPAVVNGKGYPVGLGIIPAGTTSERNDARAVAAAVQRRLRDMHVPVTRTPLTIGGAPAALLAPMPGAGPTAEIVLAHQGVLYTILAFKNRDGDPLRPDQRQALASLRFIPRVGPFPTVALPPATVPLPPPPSLVLAGAGASRDVLTVQVGGKGFQLGEVVELRACWTGTPRGAAPGVHVVLVDRRGADDQPRRARHAADHPRGAGGVHGLPPAGRSH